MKILYDPDSDMLQLTFAAGPVEETTQIAPGLVLDYDADGRVIGLEIRKASQRTDNPYGIQYQIGPANLNKPMPKVTD